MKNAANTTNINAIKLGFEMYMLVNYTKDEEGKDVYTQNSASKVLNEKYGKPSTNQIQNYYKDVEKYITEKLGDEPISFQVADLAAESLAPVHQKLLEDAKTIEGMIDTYKAQSTQLAANLDAEEEALEKKLEAIRNAKGGKPKKDNKKDNKPQLATTT